MNNIKRDLAILRKIMDNIGECIYLCSLLRAIEREELTILISQTQEKTITEWQALWKKTDPPYIIGSSFELRISE